VEFLGSLRYKIMSSANRDNLAFPSIFESLFISCSCLIWNSKTIMNRSEESGDHCLVPDFNENGFSCSPFSMMLTIGLLYITFIMLRNIPSIPSLFRDFYHERVLNFVISFFCVY
jgi:hypothetical protein